MQIENLHITFRIMISHNSHENEWYLEEDNLQELQKKWSRAVKNKTLKQFSSMVIGQ